MPRPDPAFAVVIPTFNRRPLIGEPLESVLSQRHPAAEVLVVDDGSDDGTADFVRRRYPSVTVLARSRAGVCAARNAGVAATTAPLIAFCDSDDLWDADHLALRAALFDAHPEVDFSFGDCRLLRDGRLSSQTKFAMAPPDWWPEGRPILQGAAMLYDQDLYPRILRFQPIFQPTIVVSRRAFHLTGGYDERFGFTVSEDLEFTLRCLRFRPIAAVLQPTVFVRKHTGNMSGDWVGDLIGEVAILRHALATHDAATPYRPLITEQIDRRLSATIDAAFAVRRFAVARRAGGEYGWSRCRWGQRLKLLIAHLPKPLAALLADAAEGSPLRRVPATAP